MKLKVIQTAFIVTLISLATMLPLAYAEDREELSYEMWTLDWDTISVDAGDVIEQMLRDIEG